MVQNLNPNEIYQFIVSDSRGAWDSIAGNYNQSIGRGNFMFAFQAMNLLEFASRLCANNSKLLNNFSDEINRIVVAVHTYQSRKALASINCCCRRWIYLVINK